MNEYTYFCDGKQYFTRRPEVALAVYEPRPTRPFAVDAAPTEFRYVTQKAMPLAQLEAMEAALKEIGAKIVPIEEKIEQ